MKDIELNKDFFNDLFNITCVEGVLLYILKANKVKYQSLFYKSFLTLSEIMTEFIYHNATYTNFNSIKRIQDIAINEGVISMSLIDETNIPYLDNDSYLCIMVNSEFSQIKHNRKLWNEEHYILLSNRDVDSFYYVNMNPYCFNVVTKDELAHYYDGKAIEIKLCDTAKLNNIDYYKSKSYKGLHTENIKINYDIVDINTLRDIIGILRVLRNRLFYLHEGEDVFNKYRYYIDLLNRNYAILEYMRLKNINDVSKVNSIIDSVNMIDNELILDVLERGRI